MFWLEVLASLGGVTAVLGFIFVIGRGIFKQVNATEELSHAVKELTESIGVIRSVLNSHETRIAILEDRMKR